MHTTSNKNSPDAGANAEYLVRGMTCEHCVASVTEELSELDTVTGVDVALNAGETSVVTVHSSAALDTEAVRAAITEAGYELVTTSS